ncbi:MAG: MarR family transcriptional regulator, partial [Qipengyuania sp.]
MQADFEYEPVRDASGCQLSVTVLADRDHVRAEMREDALAAGFRLRDCCSLEEYAQGPLAALGDLVLVDCAEASADALALLSRLDMRGGKAGAQLVVSTTMGALDDVFGCFSMSAPQILVDPARAERVIAIGRVLARIPNLRLREMGEEDRLMLLRLTEQVGRIAERLERLSPGQREGG